MGQLNIKDAALIAEAKELAALLGTSTTGALREAVRERLAREKRGRGEDAARRAEAILAYAAAFRARRAGKVMSNAELDALLYDPDTGLPR
jgi:hypothetical protein